MTGDSKDRCTSSLARVSSWAARTMLAPPYSSETLLVENEEYFMYRQFSLSYNGARGKAPRAAANKGTPLRRNQASPTHAEASAATVCTPAVAASRTSSAHLGTQVCHGGQISTFTNRVKDLSVHPLLSRRSSDGATCSPKQPASVPSSALYRKPQLPTVCTIGSAKCTVAPLPPHSSDPANTDVLSGCLLDDDDDDSCCSTTAVPPPADCLHRSVHEELRAARVLHSAVASTEWQFNFVPEAVVDSAIVSPSVSPETHRDPAEVSPSGHCSPVTCTITAGQDSAGVHGANQDLQPSCSNASEGPAGYFHVHSNPATFLEPSYDSPVVSPVRHEALRLPLKCMASSSHREYVVPRAGSRTHSRHSYLHHSMARLAVATGSHITASPPRTHRSQVTQPDTVTTHTGYLSHAQVESAAAFTAMSRAGSCATPADSSLPCMSSRAATQQTHDSVVPSTLAADSSDAADYNCMHGSRWQPRAGDSAANFAHPEQLRRSCLQHGYRGSAAANTHGAHEPRPCLARNDSFGSTCELDSPNPRSHSSPRASDTVGFSHPRRSSDPFLDEGNSQATSVSTAAIRIPAMSTYLDAASRPVDAAASYGSAEAGQPVFGTFANVPAPPARPIRSVFPSGGSNSTAQRKVTDQGGRHAGWSPYPGPMPRPLMPESDVVFSSSVTSGRPMQGVSYDGDLDGHLPSEASDASCAPTEIANTVWCFCGGGETIFGSACGCGGRASFASVGDTSLFGDNASCVSPEKRACTCPCHQEPATRPPATDGALWECDCNCAELAEPANITTAHVARAVYRGGYEGHHQWQRYWHAGDDARPPASYMCADEFACGDVEDSQSLSRALAHGASMRDMHLPTAASEAVPYKPRASPPCTDVGLCALQPALPTTSARRDAMHQKAVEACRSREANTVRVPPSHSGGAAQTRCGPFFCERPAPFAHACEETSVVTSAACKIGAMCHSGPGTGVPSLHSHGPNTETPLQSRRTGKGAALTSSLPHLHNSRLCDDLWLAAQQRICALREKICGSSDSPPVQPLEHARDMDTQAASSLRLRTAACTQSSESGHQCFTPCRTPAAPSTACAAEWYSTPPAESGTLLQLLQCRRSGTASNRCRAVACLTA